MKKKMISFVIALFSVLCCTCRAEVPYNACMDDVGMLSATAQAQIREIGNRLYQSGKIQFAVKVVPECNDTLTDGRKFFNSVGIGDKEKNNGLLLYVNAKNFKANKSNNNKIRFLVGYGLEGWFTDSRTGEILDEGLAESGIDNKILRMVNLVDQTCLKLGDKEIPQKGKASVGMTIIAFILIIIVIAIIVAYVESDGGSYYGGGGGFSWDGGGVGGGFGGGSCGGGGAGR